MIAIMSTFEIARDSCSITRERARARAKSRILSSRRVPMETCRRYAIADYTGDLLFPRKRKEK